MTPDGAGVAALSSDMVESLQQTTYNGVCVVLRSLTATIASSGFGLTILLA